MTKRWITHRAKARRYRKRAWKQRHKVGNHPRKNYGSSVASRGVDKKLEDIYPGVGEGRLHPHESIGVGLSGRSKLINEDAQEFIRQRKNEFVQDFKPIYLYPQEIYDRDLTEEGREEAKRNFREYADNLEEEGKTDKRSGLNEEIEHRKRLKNIILSEGKLTDKDIRDSHRILTDQIQKRLDKTKKNYGSTPKSPKDLFEEIRIRNTIELGKRRRELDQELLDRRVTPEQLSAIPPDIKNKLVIGIPLHRTELKHIPAPLRQESALNKVEGELKENKDVIRWTTQHVSGAEKAIQEISQEYKNALINRELDRLEPLRERLKENELYLQREKEKLNEQTHKTSKLFKRVANLRLRRYGYI